jgi:hypothetical protein
LLRPQINQDGKPPGGVRVQGIVAILHEFQDCASFVLLRGVLADRLQALREPPVVAGLLEELDAASGPSQDRQLGRLVEAQP